jgi:hypothetical protein
MSHGANRSHAAAPRDSGEKALPVVPHLLPESFACHSSPFNPLLQAADIISIPAASSHWIGAGIRIE